MIMMDGVGETRSSAARRCTASILFIEVETVPAVGTKIIGLGGYG